MQSLSIIFASLGMILNLDNAKILRVPQYEVSEAPVEALTEWETPEGDGGYSDMRASKNDILRGLCEKYDYYRVWISEDNQVTNYRVLVCNNGLTYDQSSDTYYFKEGQYYSFNSYSTYIARYYVSESYKQGNWQRNYSNVPKDGLPGFAGVSNEANKVNQQNFKTGVFIGLLMFFYSLANICIFGRGHI